jgi:hypothetical protein
MVDHLGSLRGELVGEQVHQQGVTPGAVCASFASAANTYRTKSDFAVAADSGRVVGGRVYFEAPVAMINDEVLNQGPDGVGADSPAVDFRGEVDVDCCVPIATLRNRAGGWRDS